MIRVVFVVALAMCFSGRASANNFFQTCLRGLGLRPLPKIDRYSSLEKRGPDLADFATKLNAGVELHADSSDPRESAAAEAAATQWVKDAAPKLLRRQMDNTKNERVKAWKQTGEAVVSWSSNDAKLILMDRVNPEKGIVMFTDRGDGFVMRAVHKDRANPRRSDVSSPVSSVKLVTLRDAIAEIEGAHAKLLAPNPFIRSVLELNPELDARANSRRIGAAKIPGGPGEVVPEKYLYSSNRGVEVFSGQFEDRGGATAIFGDPRTYWIYRPERNYKISLVPDPARRFIYQITGPTGSKEIFDTPNALLKRFNELVPR